MASEQVTDVTKCTIKCEYFQDPASRTLCEYYWSKELRAMGHDVEITSAEGALILRIKGPRSLEVLAYISDRMSDDDAYVVIEQASGEVRLKL